MDERRAWALAAALVFAAVIGAKLAAVALNPAFTGRYVSDEIWYVSAARNIAYLLGLRPRPCSVAYATLFYNSSLSMLMYAPFNATTLNSATAVVLPWPPRGDYHATATRCCWSYPDKEGIGEYLNLEHPPLAKYIIAVAMSLLGDCPVYWRLPGVALVTLAAGLAAYALVDRVWREEGPGAAKPLAAFIMSFSPVFLLGASSLPADALAMLEPYVAGFGLLAVAAALLERRRAAYILAALSTLSKYTGVGYLAAVALYDRLSSGLGAAARRLAAYTVAVAALAYAPLAARLGIRELVEKTLGGLEWFLESRPPGPPPSNPLDWMLGLHAFPLSAKPPLAAAPNPAVYTGGLLASILLLALASRRRHYAPVAAPLPVFTLAMSLVYAAGNHTLYSYYVAAYEPLAALALAAAVAEALHPRLLYAELRSSVAAWASLPEARLAATLLGPRGAPLAAMAALVALGARGSPPPGIFALAAPHSRLDEVLVYSSLMLLAATATVWRRASPPAAAAAEAATMGWGPAAALLVAVLGVESPGAAAAAPIATGLLSAIAFAPVEPGGEERGPLPRRLAYTLLWRPRYILVAAAVYVAARALGVAPPPTIADYAAFLAGLVWLRLVGEPSAALYAALALLEPRAALLASALLLAEDRLLGAAVLEAAAYAVGGAPGVLLGLVGLAASLYRDYRLAASRLGSARRGASYRAPATPRPSQPP